VTENEAGPEAIRQVHDAWITAELRGDVDAVLSLCTHDVRWLVPGRPAVEGREATRQLLQAGHVDLLDIRTTDLRVECGGALAVKTSGYETRYHMDGEEKVGRGTHLWVLRREGATWQVALVTWLAEE